ncbi:glycosyltransferase family 4 protein [Variovorax defluvii]|uniref:Glycosyltransferase family 4 protein n=1 Tax=Variovorax defluvii TaxID=913761 RepID=A0ABP8HD45_9BURK
MAERSIPPLLRRLAKGAWWLATPWRTGERLRARREHARAAADAAALSPFEEAEAVRFAHRRRGDPVLPAPSLDLFDDADIAAAAGLPAQAIHWGLVSAESIRDTATGARFLVDLWRTRADLRERFPQGWTERGRAAFEAWLGSEGAQALGLDGARLARLVAALNADLGARARQAFLSHDRAGRLLPHGLTPAGMRSLWRWFMRRDRQLDGLRLEEIWWLFLQAAQNPGRELMLAYAFAPAWQRARPEGMTVFGRAGFVDWFVAEYGAAGAWLNPATWPDFYTPADQVRVAYRNRPAWRQAHPRAFAGLVHAQAFLSWLTTDQAGLDVEAKNWLRSLDASAIAAELASCGANVIGHFCYPSGLRVSVESMVEGMRVAGVPTSLRDVLTDARDEPRHAEYHGLECHDITILHTQPEPFFDVAYERAHLAESPLRSYRIAYWYWEFDRIPEAWVAHAAQVDEVWAATEFGARGLRERLQIPVRTLFPGVRLAPFTTRSKSHFGLPEAEFTFLFSFHMVSVMERKNPLGLIRAFRQAFRKGEAVRLVLKTSFGDRHPVQMRELRAAAAGAPITLIDEVYSPDEVLSLMNACDAYVSLHRSEGLGLTMAEAMLMGKPVIATGFSGNVDFMDADNSLLVPYRLVPLGTSIPPYDAGLHWAEPSLAEAARMMRRLYDDRGWARELGVRASASARANLSLEAAGQRIAARLAEIRELRTGSLAR